MSLAESGMGIRAQRAYSSELFCMITSWHFGQYCSPSAESTSTCVPIGDPHKDRPLMDRCAGWTGKVNVASAMKATVPRRAKAKGFIWPLPLA